MEYRISDLLDCLEDAGQALEPRGGNVARVRQRTFEKLHREQPPGREAPLRREQPPRRRPRPLAVLIAAAAAVLLLCGSAFAAWKLGAFRFADEFGPGGELLDAWAQSCEPGASDAVPAAFGYADWVRAEAGDYNLTLLDLSASGTELRATVDVSPKREGLPALRDSGLALRFADYETLSAPPRRVDLWKDRVELHAALDEPLPPDAEIALCLSGPDTEPCLAVFRLDALDSAREQLASAERRHYAAAAETKDYRFSLRSLTAGASVIYAVIDAEALTDYGRAHLDQIPELMLFNHSRQNSGTHLDARLVGREEGIRRYLIGYMGDQPVNEPGDSISFEILELFEEGDLSGHPYYLFDVRLEQLIPDAIAVSDPQGDPGGSVVWQSLQVDALGLTLEGRGQYRQGEFGPTVELLFRDGTRETVLDADWLPQANRSPHDAAFCDRSGRHDGSAHLSLVFGAPLDPAELKAVFADGQLFQIAP